MSSQAKLKALLDADVFRTDALTMGARVVSFTQRYLGRSGLFKQQGLPTTVLKLVQEADGVKLVPSTQRAGPGTLVGGSTRALGYAEATHLQPEKVLTKDDLMGVLAYGTTDGQIQALSAKIADIQATQRSSIDKTTERMRMLAATTGVVTDVDGNTLIDLLTVYGVSQTTVYLDLENVASQVTRKVTDATLTQNLLVGGEPLSGRVALCSESFFSALAGFGEVRDVYNAYQQRAGTDPARDDASGGFMWKGIYWMPYQGYHADGTTPFVADGLAYLVPEGLEGQFIEGYAPTTWMDFESPEGVPYYSRVDMNQSATAMAVKGQSSPLCVNTLPGATIILSMAAS